MDDRVGLFTDAGYGSLENVEPLVAAAHKRLLFVVSAIPEESLEALQNSERTYGLLYHAGVDRK